MSALSRLHCTILAILVLAPLGCRRVESTEPTEPSPPKVEQPQPKPEPEPQPVKPVALELSASGGCALDSAGELWCWGGHATRHPGLRASVGDDELLVATRVESAIDVRDFAVTDTGVCWIGAGGVAQCHLADGLARYDLGDARSLVAASDSDGETAVVVQLDHETLNSNIWPQARTYESILAYDLADPNLCVQHEDHRAVCNRVRDEQFDRGDVSGNAFTRAIAVGPSTNCLIEDSGVIECAPTFKAMSGNNLNRWIEGIDQAVSVDVGEHHACALEADGKVVCFGGNAYFQRGEGVDGVATIELPGPASAVAAAGQHSCAIIDDGIYCWGAPATGPADRWIGQNDIALDSAKLHVSGNLNCVSRTEQTTVRVEDGSRQSKVWCWGSPNGGALGWTYAGIEGAAQPRPVALPMPDIDALVGDSRARRLRCWCGDRGLPGL
jgi:hypothetical protein